jgi:hypothetical protein
MNKYCRDIKEESERAIEEIRHELENNPSIGLSKYVDITLQQYAAAIEIFEEFANVLEIPNRAELIEHTRALKNDINAVLYPPALNVIKGNFGK